MKNRGISLITLIITIIVIIILAGVVIFSLSKSNPTSKATEAVFKSDVKTFLEELELYKLNKTLETKGSFVSTSLYATETSLKYDDKVQTGTITTVIKGIEKKYNGEFEIESGELKYIGSNNDKLKWFSEVTMEEDKSEVIGNLSEWEVSAEDPSVITAYIGTSTSIEVPNVIEGVKITTVGGGEKPIYENDDITSVKISYGIEKIGQNAFNNKKSIQQISFPSSLVEIAEAAFAGSFNYANVNIPKSVEKIKSSAFAGSKINRLTINSPKINDGLTGSSYGYQVMSANIKELVISETVRELPEYAIYSATINELKIKEGLEKIGNYGFSNTKIKSEIILPNTLRYIGESSYNSVEGIGTIKIPDSVTYIGSYAFTYLNNFEKIILSKNLEYIGDRIFGLAGSVTELILPEGLKVLGVRITDYANSLKKVVIPGSIKVVNTDVFQGMSLEELVINEGVEKIEKRIFDNRSSTPINITIPSTVTEIDLAAFEAIENADSKLVINNTEGSIPGAPWGFKGTVEWKK